MEENIVDEFDLIDLIVQNRDVDKLYSLNDHAAFSVGLHQILDSVHDKTPNQLNQYQLHLFLSMHLENSGQSCGILSCLQKWFPQHLDKFVNALREIGAPKSADAIEKAIELLPKDGSWFYDSADDEAEKLLSKLDSEFSNYPDGSMPELYRKYANCNRSYVEQI